VDCAQAKSFHDELQDTLQQLSEIDAQLVTSQPVGGLPETARKQLEQLQVSDVVILTLGSLFTICGDACPLSCISAEACLTGWPNA